MHASDRHFWSWPWGSASSGHRWRETSCPVTEPQAPGPGDQAFNCGEVVFKHGPWAVESLRYYLLGHHFILETAHRALQWLTFQTVLCEFDAILHSRPITKASRDPNDLEALTPNHLLLLKTTPSLPPGQFQREEMYARCRWRQVQYMSDLFWKRWTK